MDLFLRGRTVARISEAERNLLENAIDLRRNVPARATLVERGEILDHSTILIEGFMTRYIDGADGQRQVVALHVPGDFVDLHGYPLHSLDHSIGTLTDVRIATVPHSALDRLTDEHPSLARKLWGSTLLDAAMHREWLFRLGRLDAAGRVAHFLAETNARLRAIGLSDGHSYRLPLTQYELADITGLTSIHINRVLRTLREKNVCTFRSGKVEIADIPRLHQVGQFDPIYLYLETQHLHREPGLGMARETAHG